MARKHVLPVFPSVAQIWRGGLPGLGVLVYDGVAEKRVSPSTPAFVEEIGPGVFYHPASTIYFPSGTDARGQDQLGGRDLIAWQRNPSWLYQIQFVENVAEGFANEFRICWCFPILGTPAPLPA
jgi:hypothetical protein